METKSIKQTVTFDAPPQKVYELIMDQKKHAAFTNSKVVMSKEINGKFDVFDGYCSGYNIELIDGEKIVQAWNFVEDGWPSDHYSICTFTFKHIETGTKLVFSQTLIPAHKAEELKSGWKEFYWKPMKEFLKKK